MKGIAGTEIKNVNLDLRVRVLALNLVPRPLEHTMSLG